MKTVALTNILWFGSKFIAEYEEKLRTFTGKYVSSPVAGYVVFGVILFLSVIFIKSFSNK